MKLTPLDLRQKQFENAFRGLNPREVQGFLELVATEFEDVLKENMAVKEELRRTSLQLEQHIGREKALQETMFSAQKMTEELRRTADKEAEVLIAEAELKAERIVAQAGQRAVTISGEIAELKRQRAQLESQIESVINAHRKLLETFQSSEQANADVAYFRGSGTNG